MSSLYPKYYKVTLNSAHARYANNQFSWDVNLPLFDNILDRCKWVMNVNNFVSSADPLSGLFIGQSNLQHNPIVNVHILEFAQITSYSSKTKGIADIIATIYNNNNELYNTINTIATPVPEQWWINKQCTVYFSDIQMNNLNVSENTPFQLSIDLWKAE